MNFTQQDMGKAMGESTATPVTSVVAKANQQNDLKPVIDGLGQKTVSNKQLTAFDVNQMWQLLSLQDKLKILKGRLTGSLSEKTLDAISPESKQAVAKVLNPKAYQIALLDQKAGTNYFDTLYNKGLITSPGYAPGVRIPTIIDFVARSGENPSEAAFQAFDKLERKGVPLLPDQQKLFTKFNIQQAIRSFFSGNYSIAQRHANIAAKLGDSQFLKWWTGSPQSFYGLPIAALAAFGIPLIYGLVGGFSSGGSRRRGRHRYGSAQAEYKPNGYYNVG